MKTETIDKPRLVFLLATMSLLATGCASICDCSYNYDPRPPVTGAYADGQIGRAIEPIAANILPAFPTFDAD